MPRHEGTNCIRPSYTVRYICKSGTPPGVVPAIFDVRYGPGTHYNLGLGTVTVNNEGPPPTTVRHTQTHSVVEETAENGREDSKTKRS
jgi:hypothetical protein